MKNKAEKCTYIYEKLRINCLNILRLDYDNSRQPILAAAEKPRLRHQNMMKFKETHIKPNNNEGCNIKEAKTRKNTYVHLQMRRMNR